MATAYTIEPGLGGFKVFEGGPLEGGVSPAAIASFTHRHHAETFVRAALAGYGGDLFFARLEWLNGPRRAFTAATWAGMDEGMVNRQAGTVMDALHDATGAKLSYFVEVAPILTTADDFQAFLTDTVATALKNE